MARERVWQKVLDSYSMQEISEGKTIPFPQRDPYTNTTFIYDKSIAGTGISQYALSKFYSGEWKPSPATIRKIENFQRRELYSSLRASGANSKEAKRLSSRIDARKALHFYQKTVATLSKANKVEAPALIAAAMQLSPRTMVDWDAYTGEMDYETYDIPDDVDWEDYIEWGSAEG